MSPAYVDGLWLGVVFVVVGGYGSPDSCLRDRGARDDVMDGLGVAEDGRAKAEEGLVEDEGGREELTRDLLTAA